MRLLLAPLLLAACVVADTQVTMPSSLAGAETVPIRGTNGAMVGRVSVGEASGGFRRSRTQTTTLGVYERDGASTRFTLEGAPFAEATEVDCKLTRRAVTVQGVSSPTKPVGYECTLSRGGSLVLDEQTEVGGPHPFPIRKGYVALDGIRLTVRSLHAYEGIDRESLNPIGYSFADGDRVVGAVRMLMPPSLSVAPEATVSQRAAMTAAAAALALTWEPEGA